MNRTIDVGSGVVDVAYRALDGKSRVVPWSDIDPVSVLEGRPWRQFAWYMGQRNYSGMYWCATEANMVGYESLLELSRLVMADYDRSSKHIVSQPFQIRAVVEGKQLHRVPDYLVLTDDEPLVIDVTRKARLENPKYQRLFDLTRRIVESRGWNYELAHEPPRIPYLNTRFLAGYRRPWLFDQAVVADVRARAEDMSGASINAIACRGRFPKQSALPALMHLLWRQELTVDIAQRLSPTSMVWPRR